MSVASSPSLHTKDHPFPARLTENRLLTKPGSGKETRHFVIDLAGSGLSYKPGDSLGVFPTNDPALVDEVLERLGASGDETVTIGHGETVPLRPALLARLSLAMPTRKLVELLATKATAAAERATIERLLAPQAKEELTAFLREREYVDFLAEFPSARLTPQEFVGQLRRLMPRLYSIASSERAHPAEVHLTVAIVRYTTNGRRRAGVCSTFLADRVGLRQTAVPVFVSHSHFGLPERADADVIMVGPGTGVAPFRAFLEERAATAATGRSWLFFGDQHRATDFLYETEFTAWQERGVLTRLDTAFSRDQAHKIYVQDRMRENGAELWRWISAGANFYVCGDAKRMAPDVDHALQNIVTQHGGMDATQAAEYVKTLRKEKRYQRDVY
jgi:sulfite reductase (NADPH) flavoprotein alpha-component